MKHIIFFLVLLFVNFGFSQNLTGSELLEKSVVYHDPNGNWGSFNDTLKIRMETPNSSDRLSMVYLNLPQEIFTLKVSKDSDSYIYEFKGEKCETTLNGSNVISEEDQKRLRLTCERGKSMRNYYTYLYGLPMKLKDPGTIIHNEVKRKVFKGKEYLVLKASYDPEVGKDTWYFYFDPQNYAMEIYQFYHDESKNDGEYILLNGLEEISGVKMPKIRKWYYNKDDKFLGVDILN